MTTDSTDTIQVLSATRMRKARVCLALLAAARLAGMVTILRGYVLLPPVVDTSIYGPGLVALAWQIAGVLCVCGVIWGLDRRKLWGWAGAGLIAFLSLPTACFPLSLLIAWYLIPQPGVDWLKAEVYPLFRREFQTDPSVKD